MTLDYETCRAIKDAGFPQTPMPGGGHFEAVGFVEKEAIYKDEPLLANTEYVYVPTLSELIDGCGDSFQALWKSGGPGWTAANSEWCGNWVGSENEPDNAHAYQGPTPEAAVAALYLATHGKENV